MLVGWLVGAQIPEHQAPPATREQVLEACEWLLPDEAAGLTLAWKTCSRIDDVKHLRKLDLQVVDLERRILGVTFPTHKGDPFRVGTAIPMTCNLTEWKIFMDQLDKLKPEDKFTTLTTLRANAVLKRVKAELSAHSVKRGALVSLLRKGVPLSVIQLLAKHKDLETLWIYPPRLEVALSLGLQDATKLL